MVLDKWELVPLYGAVPFPILPALILRGLLLVAVRAFRPVVDTGPGAEEGIAPTWSDVDNDGVTAAVEPADELPSAAGATDDGEVEREIDRSAVLAGCGLGLAIIGMGAPILGPVSGAVVLYSAFPLFQRAHHAAFKERRMRGSVLDSIAVACGIITGFYVASALCCTMYFLGAKLLRKTEDRSLSKLVTIFDDRGRIAWLWKDGVEMEVQVADLQPGDIIVVDAGQVVPIDGMVCDGALSIDEHQLTGESRPVEKIAGDPVLASTMVLAGRARIEVERTGASTVVAQIGSILNKTADYRVSIESRAEQLGDQSVLPILGLAAISAPFVGIQGTLAILSSNFTECLRVVQPLSMLNFLSLAADRGVLIKDGRALELLSSVDTVVFDKTGTLTVEQPHVGSIITCNGISPDELLIFAAAAEAKQSHPIARAILQEAKNWSLSLPTLEDAHYHAGFGIEAMIDGRRILVGSARFMVMSDVADLDQMHKHEAEAHELGHTLVHVAVDGRLGGAVELRPTVRAELRGVVETLRARGLSLYIISGDHEAPTRRLALEFGIDHYFAEVLPQDKSKLVRQLQAQGRKVCFVGDGINDAIALKAADASISLRGATTVATDTAQVILMDGTLRELPGLFKLCSEFASNARTTSMLTFGPAAVSLGGALFFHFGIYASIMLFNLSLAASVGNAMLPMVRRKDP